MSIPNVKDPRVPATIRNHPAVMYCVPGEVEGSDYRYWVELHREWIFTRGAKENCTGGGVNTVRDFLYYRPELKK
jgi:hypothetical protein